MGGTKKPRKPYRPRDVCLDAMDRVKGQVRKPRPDELAPLLRLVRKPVVSLRQGVATELEWSIVSGAVQVARAIEAMRIVRGLTGYLDSADAALDGIYKRAMAQGAWHPTALYFQELDAVQTFAELYTYQMNQLSRAEILQASALAQRLNKQAGNTTTVATTEEMTEQLNLIGAAA